MIAVNYTLQELQDLTALLDIAVKQQGLKVAGAAFLIHQKHAVALEMSKTEDVKQQLRDEKDRIDFAVEQNNVVPIKTE